MSRVVLGPWVGYGEEVGSDWGYSYSCLRVVNFELNIYICMEANLAGKGEAVHVVAAGKNPNIVLAGCAGRHPTSMVREEAMNPRAESRISHFAMIIDFVSI